MAMWLTHLVSKSGLPVLAVLLLSLLVVAKFHSEDLNVHVTFQRYESTAEADMISAMQTKSELDVRKIDAKDPHPNISYIQRQVTGDNDTTVAAQTMIHGHRAPLKSNVEKDETEVMEGEASFSSFESASSHRENGKIKVKNDQAKVSKKGEVILLAAVALAFAYMLPVTSLQKEAELGAEVRSHFQIAIPSFLRFFFFTLSDTVFVALVSRLDGNSVEHFDGATLGLTLINISGVSIGLGFVGAMAPFVAQECGSQREGRCGLHLRNFYKAATVIFMISCTISTFSETILLSVGQDPKVALCVQKFARIAVWALPFQLLAKGLQQVLDAQADVMPGLITDATNAFIQVPFAYVVLKAGYGYEGAAVVRVLVNAVVTSVLVIFVFWSGRGKSVWQVEAAQPPAPMLPFLQLAAWSTFATCIEWWTQEIMVILAGLMYNPVNNVAAQSILWQIGHVFYMVWIGAKNAMAIRVGNLIGSAEGGKVPQCVFVGVIASTFEVIVVMLLGFLMRDDLIGMFTGNAEVAEQVAEAWPLMLAGLVPYSITFVLFGVFSGAGSQVIVASTFGASSVISLSLSCHLCFVQKMGLDGLWYGNGTYFGIASLVLYTAVMRRDWRSVEALTCEQAKDRQITPTFNPRWQQDFKRTITPAYTGQEAAGRGVAFLAAGRGATWH